MLGRGAFFGGALSHVRFDFFPLSSLYYKEKKMTTNIRYVSFFIIVFFLHDNDHGMIGEKKGWWKGFFCESWQCKSQYLPKKAMGSLMP